MIGLARISLRLACLRVYGDAGMADVIILRPRDEIGTYPYSANAEYYRICDRITRGELP